MKKKIHPMREKGFEIEKIPSHMIDSIWRKGDLLCIVFATGQKLYFGDLTEME